MRNLVVCISNENKNITPLESMNIVKDAGFKSIFIQWYNKNCEISQEEQVKYAKDIGLNIEFAHLGYTKINAIWEEGEQGESLIEYYKKDLDNMHRLGINLVVMHLTHLTEIILEDDVCIFNELGLRRLRAITNYAKNLNIKVAFENTRIRGYLEYVLENIKDDNVGMCYDIGHNHAHFDDDLNLDLFKDRIFAIHLHDNDSTEDQHLLPFDGTINWEYNISKLKENNYNGPVTLELIYWNRYTSILPIEFYKKGYEVGLKLQSMFEEL